jgi:hypothetical protein
MVCRRVNSRNEIIQMAQKFSIALHDVRVSWNEETVSLIQHIMSMFNLPLTVHLIFDSTLEHDSILGKFILENFKKNKLEIVFHGLKHECSKNVPKWLVFYHKYQAEYLENSDALRENTSVMYKSSCNLLNQKLGICPPCWIATKKNFQFFKTLKPLYVEKMLTLNSIENKWLSPVISLGSPNNFELFFLKILARIIYLLAVIFKSKRIRVAIHICDLSNSKSISFFSEIAELLKKRNCSAVLLKDLVC